MFFFNCHNAYSVAVSFGINLVIFFGFPDYPLKIYTLKVDDRSTRKRCQICSKLTIKTSERRQWRLFCLYFGLWGYFIPFYIAFFVYLEQVNVFWVESCSSMFRKTNAEFSHAKKSLSYNFLRSITIFRLLFEVCIYYFLLVRQTERVTSERKVGASKTKTGMCDT